MDDLDSDDVVVMQQILSTETATLSAVELAAFRGEAIEAVRDRLDRLATEDESLVTTLEVDQPVDEDVPRRYYAVTQSGVDALKEMRMYDQIGILYDVYGAANDPETPEGWASIDTIRDVRPVANWLIADARDA